MPVRLDLATCTNPSGWTRMRRSRLPQVCKPRTGARLSLCAPISASVAKLQKQLLQLMKHVAGEGDPADD